MSNRETDGRVNMIGEGGVGTGTYSAESNLPGATCVGIADGGACMNGEGRTGIGTDLAELNLPGATSEGIADVIRAEAVVGEKDDRRENADEIGLPAGLSDIDKFFDDFRRSIT